MFYAEDLSHIHHTGFGAFATRAAPGLFGYLKDAGIAHGLVVDLGCGSGLWVRALLQAGYGEPGGDCSAAMLDLARSFRLLSTSRRRSTRRRPSR